MDPRRRLHSILIDFPDESDGHRSERQPEQNLYRKAICCAVEIEKQQSIYCFAKAKAGKYYSDPYKRKRESIAP
jgi:hypothetical protein